MKKFGKRSRVLKSMSDKYTVGALSVAILLAMPMNAHFASIDMFQTGVGILLSVIATTSLIAGCWAFGRLADLGVNHA